MRLSKIEFSNFRCFRSEVVEFGDYTSLVGPNNCGKSTALSALNIFFGGGARRGQISNEDFYIGAEIDAELKLRFEFVDVTGSAAEELAHYVRDQRVIFEIIATRSGQGEISSRCRGIRYGLLQLAPFFEATTAAARRPLYDGLRTQYPDEIPSWQSNQIAEETLRNFEASRADQHVAIPSEENAYGATGPIPRLRKYVDWIYVPAVKDASSEASEQRESAFSKLISFAVRSRCDFAEKIAEIKATAADALRTALDDAATILATVGGDIDREFKNLTTTPIDVAIDWGPIDDIAVREPIIRSTFKDGRVLGAPEIFGHGLQRTYLMALLALAARTQGDDNFRLILGIEEPELYQHPPQARFLAGALTDLSAGSCQVLVTTHSPHFISGRTFESVRVLRKRENATQVHSWTVDQQRGYSAERKGTAAIGAGAALSGIDRALQVSTAEMFFAGKVILVEGAEDIAIIESYLKCVGKLSAFLRAGCHFVAAGGKTKMPMLIALSRGFSIDVFTVFDLDLDKENDQNNLEIIRYALDAGDLIGPEPVAEYAGDFFFGWRHNIQAAMIAECERWIPTKTAIANEWGWSLGRMDKDPMLLGEAISRVRNETAIIPPLARLTEKLEKVWSR